MEAKTSYSSMAAKPLAKANDASPTTNNMPKLKNPTGAKRNLDRFVGHNQTDLKGILIPEDANAKHYNELKDRLGTLGGSKYIPQVGSSIEHLVRFERKDFAPTKPTAAEYSTAVTDPITQDIQMVEVPGLKDTLMDMYKEELKKKANEWIQYQRDMEKVYQLALGQIDDGMKAKLKGLKSWKAIDSSKCIVELLKAVRDLCFQSSRTKVHPITNVIWAIRKLLCTQQRHMDAASYVKMMKENLHVVKSLVSYELERNPTYVDYDYSTYPTLTGPTTRAAIDHAVEQRALAALIIEGADTDNSNLCQVLADNYALRQNNYPATSVEALDMVVAFKDSKKPKSRTNNRNTPTGTPQNGRQCDRKKDDSPDQGSSLFAQQGTAGGGTTNLSNDQHSRQLLMTAVESGEAFTPSKQTTYMFLNIGMLSQIGEESSDPDSSTSPTSSSSGSCMSTNYDSEDNYVPDLVPRTNRYPDDKVEESTPNEEPNHPHDYYFSNDVEYLFTQSKLEGGVNSYWILLNSESSLNLIVNRELVNNIRMAQNNGFMEYPL
eukprot:jgi/Psemu1/23528/gm1.23528_g